MKDNHTCIDNSLAVNCPVCQDFLMDSLKTASILKCGHAMCAPPHPADSSG